MGDMFLGILSGLFTGSLAAATGALVSFHGRFIRLEEGVKTLRREVSSMRRVLVQGMRRIELAAQLPDLDKDPEGEQW
jgi:hypothetical protein